jgi:hypothetical protein
MGQLGFKSLQGIFHDWTVNDQFDNMEINKIVTNHGQTFILEGKSKIRI